METMEYEAFRNYMRNTKNNQYCFVLGAGASVECNIKSGEELTSKWFQELLKKSNLPEDWKQSLTYKNIDKESRQKEIDKIAKDSKLLSEILNPNELSIERSLSLADFLRIKYVLTPGEAYAVLINAYCPTMDERRNEMENITKNGKVTEGYLALAKILNQTRNNIVITTNFDEMIEKAFTELGSARSIPFKVSGTSNEKINAFRGNMLSRKVSGCDRPLIMKVHGSITDSRILNTLEETRYLSDAFGEKLASVFEIYTPIFIGYAGGDIALMDMLVRYGRKFDEHQRDGEIGCFWLVYGSEEEIAKLPHSVRDYLRAVNGRCVTHEGFEKTMVDLATDLIQAQKVVATSEMVLAQKPEMIHRNGLKINDEQPEARSLNNQIERNERKESYLVDNEKAIMKDSVFVSINGQEEKLQQNKRLSSSLDNIVRFLDDAERNFPKGM